MKIVDINGTKYIIEPFKGRKGFKLKTRIAKIISPALAELETNIEGLSDSGIVLKAIQSVIESTESDEIFNLVEEIVTGAKTENGAIDFDTEFSKNYMTLYKLIKEIVIENYGDVFQGLGMNVG